MKIALCGLARLLSFCSESEQGRMACPARGDAPDTTASWQQVGVTSRREPARRGVDHGLAGEYGGEHHRPAGSYAKMASVFKEPDAENLHVLE
jgi:hypothetical protein